MVPLHSKGVIRRHRLRRVRQSREIDKTTRKKKNRKRRRCSKRERSSRVGEGTLWGRNVFILRSSSVLQSLSTGSPFPFLFSDALPHPLESLPNSHTGTSPTTTTIENDDDDDARCRLGFLTHSFAHLQLFQHAFDATAWGCPLVSLYITEYTERERERDWRSSTSTSSALFRCSGLPSSLFVYTVPPLDAWITFGKQPLESLLLHLPILNSPLAFYPILSASTCR